jgi:hypothetical protein
MENQSLFGGHITERDLRKERLGKLDQKIHQKMRVVIRIRNLLKNLMTFLLKNLLEKEARKLVVNKLQKKSGMKN